MKINEHTKMILAAALGVDPHAQLMTNVQMAAMLDAALVLHLDEVLKRLDELKSLLSSKAQEPQVVQEPESPAHVDKAPCKYGERTMMVKELVPIFSLSRTSFVRLIQAGVLPYDRAARGAYLLNGAEVWDIFQTQYKVEAMPSSGKNRKIPTLEQLQALHESNPGRLLWNAVDLARALGVDANTVHSWRRNGLAHFVFTLDETTNGLAFRYDLQDIIAYFTEAVKK